MKRFPTFPASLFLFLLFPLLFLFIKRKWRYGLAYILIASVLCSGCFQLFYSTNTKPGLNTSTLDSLKNSNKYVIIHLKTGIYELKNIKVNDSLLEGNIEQLSPNHDDVYLHPEPGSSPSFLKKDKNYVLNEIHLYAPNQVLLDTAYISLHDSSITRVDIYEKNIKKTKTNRAISTVAVIVIPLGILVALIAIACNCPQVYAYDGTQYQFKSGVFSGAIYTPLEKTDYLPLENLIADSGKFKFRVMNNQQEEQFINQLQLIKVSHDTGTNVLLDRYGIVHTYRQPQAPIITSLTNDDTRQTLKWKDGHSFMFNEKGDTASNFGSVVLSFDIPAGTKQSKLIVNAKNSLWAGYIFEEFTSLFGDKFQKYQTKQDKANKQKIERWQKEQALSLMVYVETEKGWELADYFPTTGNTAGREMIMTINIPDKKQAKIRIKLESAFMFWELDYAAMDFSEDQQLKPEFISASSSVKSNSSINDTGDIISKDGRYSKLLQDEFISVEFNKTNSTAHQESYFLSSTGYYHSLKQYAGKPDIARLRNFKKKGSFTEFSENMFIEDQKLLAKGINLQTTSKK